MTQTTPKIGDEVVDDCGHIGTVDALPSDRVQIDVHEWWTIPPSHVGIRHIDQSWHIIKTKLIRRS